MARPAVDVVVPFRGERDVLAELTARLSRLELRDGDTILVVDNTPGALRSTSSSIPVLHADELASPGYARNRGAERGGNEWIVFIDADTEPVADLLDRYFDPPPSAETVLLAGGVRDEPVPANAPGAARYAYLKQTMNQTRTLIWGSWSFVQSSNVACRRSAFEAIGGFHEGISAAEDADLSYRLGARGGAIERREPARVVHHSRRTLRAFVARTALYGGGAAWLERHYPGSWPPRRRLGLVWWALRFSAKHLWRAVRRRDRDQLVWGIYEPLWELAYEFGRSRSVELSPSRGGRHG